RAERAFGGRGQHVNGQDRRGRYRGQADGRPHPDQHHCHPPTQGRRHRRLRDHRAGAPLLHPADPPTTPRRHTTQHRGRTQRYHLGRTPRGQGSGLPGGCAPGLHHRRTHGRSHRRGTSDPRTHRKHGGGHRRGHHRGRRHLHGRDRHLPIHPCGR